MYICDRAVSSDRVVYREYSWCSWHSPDDSVMRYTALQTVPDG